MKCTIKWFSKGYEVLGSNVGHLYNMNLTIKAYE